MWWMGCERDASEEIQGSRAITSTYLHLGTTPAVALGFDNNNNLS